MFVKTTHVGFAQRVVATLVACALIMASYGYYSSAQAANLTDISDTVTDSSPGAVSGHTIAFTIPTGSGLAITDVITIDFGGNFTIGQLPSGDITLTVNGGGATFSALATTSNTISFTSDTLGNAGEEVVVAIADGTITNSAVTTSHEIIVDTGAGGDTGKTRVAIIDTVLVTAIVDTVFDFAIAGTATGTAVNGDVTTGSTTATAIPFGVLTADTAEIRSQELTVATNARNGFSVTVQTDGDLESSTGAIIDSFTDGTDIAVAGTAWTAPGDDVNDELTWGHWGMTSDDTDLANDLDAADSYIAASTTAREVFSHTGPADGSTQDIGLAVVGYQIEITPLQEAADDYQAILTYIATPTF